MTTIKQSYALPWKVQAKLTPSLIPARRRARQQRQQGIEGRRKIQSVQTHSNTSCA